MTQPAICRHPLFIFSGSLTQISLPKLVYTYYGNSEHILTTPFIMSLIRLPPTGYFQGISIWCQKFHATAFRILHQFCNLPGTRNLKIHKRISNGIKPAACFSIGTLRSVIMFTEMSKHNVFYSAGHKIRGGLCTAYI